MTLVDTTLPAGDKSRLNDLWRVAEMAGVHRARQSQENAIEAFEAAQAAVRETKAAVVEAKEELAERTGFAELVAGGSIVKEGNKTFVRIRKNDPKHGNPPAGEEYDQRQVTADEAKAHVARTVAQHPGVVNATRSLRAAEMAHAEAADRLTAADKRISAAKSDLQAATGLLATLTTTWSHQ